MTAVQEPELIYSDLNTRYTEEGRSVDITIYRLPDSDWVLEVVADDGNSPVCQHGIGHSLAEIT